MAPENLPDDAATARVVPSAAGRANLFFGRVMVGVSIGPAPPTPHKQEGDAATPIGILPIRRVFFRADRVARPRVVPPVPVEPMAPDDGWCDDRAHADYNRYVSLPHPARCEALWRQDHSYDIVVVLGWNDDPVIAGRGSAIFLHLPTSSGATEGCVAMEESALRALLAAGIGALRVEG